MPQSGRVVFGKMEEVIFGQPAAQAVADQVARVGAQRVFIMASGTLNRETDEIEQVRRALGNKCVGTFAAMPAHTPRAAVIVATNQAREAGADLIVTIGGGSITDGAKAVQLCLANNVTTVAGMDALLPVEGAPPPGMQPPSLRQITVPTTLSAGEFSHFSGVTNEATQVKQLFLHPMVMPSAVILDPALTRHTPEWLFLSTGIRAVDHCVEGFCSLEGHPYADAQALRGLALLARGLKAVKADPGNIEARMDCQLGSWLSMGPLASGVPMGASHGIGYVLGAVFDVPHGHTSCIMLPYVMKWNKTHNAAKQAEIAAALHGAIGGPAGQDAGDALDGFIGGLGMPRSLGAVQVGREHFDRIAKQAMGTPWIPRNPRPIPTPAEVREILELAA